jgi:hypothetical protein
MKVGDHVRIIDFSEAHGDLGVIDFIQDNGIILVELTEYGTIWPILEDSEIELVDSLK